MPGVGETAVREWRDKLIASSQIAKIETRTATRNGTTYQWAAFPFAPGTPGTCHTGRT
jgi:hypothetical protein